MPKTEERPVTSNGAAPEAEAPPLAPSLTPQRPEQPAPEAAPPPALIGLEVNVAATFAEDLAVEDGLRRPGPPYQVFASLPFTREAFVGLFDALLAQARLDQAERAQEPTPE